MSWIPFSLSHTLAWTATTLRASPSDNKVLFGLTQNIRVKLPSSQVRIVFTFKPLLEYTVPLLLFIA